MLATFVQVGLPIALLMIMFSIGLKLQASAFVSLFRAPRELLAGLFSQLLLVPLSALLLVWLLAPPFAVGMGLIILALSPGGITSNLFSDLSRADIALSVSLTLVASLVTPFSLPVFTALALAWLGGEGREIDFPVLISIARLLVITLLPLSLAMLIRRYWPAVVRRIIMPASVLASGLFATVILSMLMMRWDVLPALLRENGLPVALLLGMTFGAGALLTTALRLPRPQARTIIIESGLQNGAMALLITDTVLASPGMSSLVVFYGIAMLIPALLTVAWGRREAT